MKFSERLKSRREQERYSQKEIGELVGVRDNTVWRWENGKAKPDIETVVKIANVLDTTAAYLLGEINNPSPYVLQTLPANEQQLDFSTLLEKVADENSEIKEPITVGRKNNMYIIKEGKREFCIPDNEEGRKIFLTFLQSSLKGIGIVSNPQTITQQIHNGTNSTYLDSVVNNGTQIVAQNEKTTNSQEKELIS